MREVNLRLGDYTADTNSWTCSSSIDSQIQAVMQAQQVADRVRIWRENLISPLVETPAHSAIFATVRSVRRAIDFFGPDSIDLSSVKVDDTNPVHLIAVFRAAYAWRKAIPGWDEALDAAPRVLEAHGINSRRELAGLKS